MTFADQILGWQQRHKRALLPAALLALGYSWSISAYRDYQFGIQQFLPRLLVIFFLLVYAFGGLQKARLIPMGILGTAIGFFTVAMPVVLTPEGQPRPWQLWLVLPFVFFSCMYTLCLCGASALLQPVDLKSSQAQNAWQSKKRLVLIWLALLAFWMPYFLAFGPVRISADSYVVLGQALHVNPWDDSHPILYTFLLQLVFTLTGGNMLLGAYVFGFGQMAFLAACAALSLWWMLTQGCPPLWALLCFLYFAVTPVFAVNGFTLWKDIPFNALLMLWILMLVCLCDTQGAWLSHRPNLIAFLATATGICFFRGNGYPIVLLVIALLVLFFPGRRKQFLLYFVPLLVIIALIRGPIYQAAGISRLGSVEAAAMPLQQVSRIVARQGELTPEQKEIIERFVPLSVMAENYQSISPDFIKKHTQFNTQAFEDNLGDFMGQVWLPLMMAHPGEYANAWLLQTLGYWKYDFIGRTIYTEDEYNGAFDIQYKDLIYKFTGANFRQFAIDRQTFLSLATLAYLVLFIGGHFIATRRARYLIALSPLLIIWLGLMIGAPTYWDYRYMFVFPLALPAITFVALRRSPQENSLQGKAV